MFTCSLFAYALSWQSLCFLPVEPLTSLTSSILSSEEVSGWRTRAGSLVPYDGLWLQWVLVLSSPNREGPGTQA